MKGILKGLFSLCISIVGIVSFCNAEKVESLVNYSYLNVGLSGLDTNSSTTNYSKILIDLGEDGTNYGTYCLKLKSVVVSDYTTNKGSIMAYIGQSDSITAINVQSFASQNTRNTLRGNQIGYITCIPINKRFIIGVLKSSNSSNWKQSTFYFDIFRLDELLDTDIPQYTSSQCQQEYSLIPIESVDQTYCENNNLCPVYTGNTGNCNTGLNWSSLYINDIQHLGGPSIYLDIPEEINWDYQYSSNEDMYIDIEGYNVNYDSISGAIAIQNYKPDSSDLNKIITELVPLFIPGLVIILFLYFVFRFIKKIF